MPPAHRSLSVTAPSGHVGAKMHLNTPLPWSRLREMPRTNIRVDRGKARSPLELHATRRLSSSYGKRTHKMSDALSKIWHQRKTFSRGDFYDICIEGNEAADESNKSIVRKAAPFAV